MAEDLELWDIICDGPHIPVNKDKAGMEITPKMRQEYNEADKKAVKKNYKAKKIPVCRIGADEYNRISACKTAKEIWETLQTAHEGTTQVKNPKIGMLITETKVNAIYDAKDLAKLIVDELIRNLKTYEMKMTLKKTKKNEVMKERNLVLKAARGDSSDNESEMGNSSSESEDENDQGNISLMTIEDEATENGSISALMAKSDTDDDDKEINFLDIEKNLKDELNQVIDETEKERDDLRISSGEMKKQIHETNQQYILLESQVREGVKISFKGKGEANETFLVLEKMLKIAKLSLIAEIEMNVLLEKDLNRVKFDFDKALN
ncbi:uncharacterized protein LOC132639188 [Lycium barbarum]|uniref:uncharacterized protein LOC132639188 n=1 Tax=Lycium barbarum TaxID=112863 RepID=UPI00293F0DC4|nr:uncharacterized protein LOC132639188 [Lycium barbarum]